MMQWAQGKNRIEDDAALETSETPFRYSAATKGADLQFIIQQI
jgi:hypothetical protein